MHGFVASQSPPDGDEDVARTVLGTIIPGARGNQDCRAGLIAGAAGDAVVPANLAFGQVPSPKERDGAVASVNFKGHRRADDEAAGGKRSRRDSPRTEAGRSESGGSGDPKATRRTGASILSHVARQIECPSPGTCEGAVQDIGDIRYLDTGDVSLVAVGTATVDGIRPGELSR